MAKTLGCEPGKTGSIPVVHPYAIRARLVFEHSTDNRKVAGSNPAGCIVLSDKEKDDTVKLAQEISKYAFALSFYSSYNKSDAEKHHCRENLKQFVSELLKISEK